MLDIFFAVFSNGDTLAHAGIQAATPLLLAALGETVVQRAGMINLGLEGIILLGAFAAMVGAYFTGSPHIGLLCAISSGIVLAGLFAALTTGLDADQVVVGIAITLLSTGLTGVLYRGLFGITGQALTVATLPIFSFPLLENIPFFGPVLFQHTILVYCALFLVPTVWFFLAYTRPGLQLQAVGEHPHAAETLGISVRSVQFSALLFEGCLAGAAGAYLSLSYSNTFIEGISAGRGFIALAIVIFGRWQPFGVLGGAILFGSATALQFRLQALGSVLPYQLALMLPYISTLLILTLFGKHFTAPAGLGRGFKREDPL
jgi:general nucleoside transport system permease protein